MNSTPVHLVCSSGGVKCFSYVGAVQKLLENNITIASVSTCSMGSIIGAMICSGLSPDEMERIITHFPFSMVNRKKAFYWFHALRYPFAIYKKADYNKILNHLLGKDLTLGEMKIPFSVAALDIRQRTLLAYSSATHPEMKISDVVRIATAIPPLSEPFKKDKRILVDAAVASESPVWMAANYPDKYPILVLKPSYSPDRNQWKTLPRFLNTLFNASAASHDNFIASDNTRVIEIDINCGTIRAEDFSLSKEDIETLIVQGQTAMEDKLKEFDGNFNNRLHVEEIVLNRDKQGNTAERAVVTARRWMTGYKTELGNRNQVFISYSDKDGEWLNRIQSFMKPLAEFTGIKTWNNTNMLSGDEEKTELSKAFTTAKVALFLVTANYLVQTEEMLYFIEMSKKEKVSILWVSVSASMYKITPLADVECANNPDIPLDTLPVPEQNIEFTKICNKIIAAMS
jgi:predicted acylesterase/phospholipase RssA